MPAHIHWVQMMAEFLTQGKHFACGLRKDVHAEKERSTLADMYQRQAMGRTIEEHVQQVRPLPSACSLPAHAHRPMHSKHHWPTLHTAKYIMHTCNCPQTVVVASLS